MNIAIKKGILNIVLLVVIFIPVAFYIAYSATNSIFWGFISSVCTYIVWTLIFGGGLKRRRKYVDILLSKNFPESKDDPLLYDEDISVYGWFSGNGYTNEIDQPLYIKVDEYGISLLYMCRASKRPFTILWSNISQINITNKKGVDGGELVRLYIPGIGMEILVPWRKSFNNNAPENIVFQK